MPSKPWERIHVDYAGPVDGMMFLVIVDSQSKWPEVIPTSGSTSAKTIAILRNIFAMYGLPNQLVSDNATTFTSEEFENFMKINGIKHITSAPYHPATNGLAERFVQSFKEALKSAKRDGGTVNHKLANFLLAYRNTAHSTTGVSPAMMFMGRRLRSRLDILKPNVHDKVANKQADQVKYRKSAKLREFLPGQKVSVRDYRSRLQKWVTGVIHARSGPVSYEVTVGDAIWRRHVDQLRDTAADIQPETPHQATPAVLPAAPDNHPVPQPAPIAQQPVNGGAAQPLGHQQAPVPVQPQTKSGRKVKPNPKYSNLEYDLK
jgi:hypothetical protein